MGFPINLIYVILKQIFIMGPGVSRWVLSD